MKLEDQCCTLSQAKRLFELGINQKSLVKHVYRQQPEEFWNTEVLGTAPTSWQTPQDIYSAYTVAELGLLLPKGLGGNDGHNWSFYHRHCWKGESVGYSAYGASSIEQEWYDNEAQSRADMLIQLLELGKVTPEQCNECLK